MGSRRLCVRPGCTGRCRWRWGWGGLADGPLILSGKLGEVGKLGKTIRVGNRDEAKGPSARGRWGGGDTVNVWDAPGEARLLEWYCGAQLRYSV